MGQHNDIARRVTLAAPLRNEKILKMQILMTLFLLIHLPTLRNFASIYSYSCVEYNPYYEFYQALLHACTAWMVNTASSYQARHFARKLGEYDEENTNIRSPIHCT